MRKILLLGVALLTALVSCSPEPEPEPEPVPENKDMPVLYLTTDSGEEVVSKTEYVPGSLTITGCDEAYALKDARLQIRGRGNFTWGLDKKKPYRIKFEEKTNLLGQGKAKAKSWTLIANYCDKSLCRNDAVFDFAKHLENIPFVSSSSFAEVYFNGRYDGVYEICDQIQVHEGRVEIDDSGSEDDIGYLVALDQCAEENIIHTDSGDSYEIKSDYQNESQKEYIEDYMNTCYSAILEGNQDTVSEYVDIPSAVDCYIVEELFKNLDVGWGSFYFTKPKGDRLHFGPVWDFDLAAGNADSDDSSTTAKFRSPEYTYVGNPAFRNYMQQSTWYTALRKTDWFEDLVKARWDGVKGYATDTIAHIEQTAAAYNEAFLRNFDRWPVLGTKINREPRSVLAASTVEGQISYLTDWLNKRIDWLTRYYDGEAEDYRR